jgi:PII-like signaling protein
MRIFIGENDRVETGPYKGKPLYEGLLLTLRERGFAGATVHRGIAGFGASAQLHTDRVLRMSADLPIIVEVVAKEEMIDEIRPELNRLIGGGLVTLEKVQVILYRPAGLEGDERWEHRIEGLEAVEDPPEE